MLVQQKLLHCSPQQGSVVVLATLLLAVAGCSDGPFSYVPVSGKVTYEDGSPIPAASIKLVFKSMEPPLDPKTRPRLGQAGVNATDGTFSGVTSEKPSDGLVPGEHKVTVFVFGKDGQTSSAIPEEYTNGATTPLVIHTKDSPLEILIPRPK